MGRRKDYPFDRRVDKQMTNLISGLLVGIILAPLLLFSSSKNKDFDCEEILGVILLPVFFAPIIVLDPFISEAFSGFNFLTQCMMHCAVYALILGIELYLVLKIIDKVENKYDYLIFIIVLRSFKSRYRKIRNDYFNTISKNKIALPKVIELHNKIKHYQCLLDKNLGEDKEKKYREIINNSHQELSKIKKNVLNIFRTDYKEPIIQLEPCNRRIKLPDFDGYIFLNIDKTTDYNKTIKFSDVLPLSKNGNMCYLLNIKPLKSLFNESIMIHFYDRYLLLMTKNNFTIVGYEDILGRYINTSVEFCLGDRNYSDSIKLNRLDSVPEYRNDNINKYVLIDVGILQLNLFSKQIHLLFTKYNEGKAILELISDIS